MKKRIILALSSLILLTLPWVGVSGVTLFAALVPMFILSESYGSTKKEFWRLFGWIALIMGAWTSATSWWIWYATPAGSFAPVAATILLFGGTFMIYHFVSKRAPKALAYTLFVSCWIALEHFYTDGEISYPWLTLGNGFANDIPFIQWYDTTGAFGGSLWVLVANLVIYEAIRTRSVRKWAAAGVIILLPAAVSLVKFFTYEEKGEPVKITVVQPNFDPYMEKFVLPLDVQADIILGLCAEAPGDVDYVVLPETAFDDHINEHGITDNKYVKMFRELAYEKMPGAQFIVGATTRRFYRSGDKIPVTARNVKDSDIWYDVYNTSLTVDTSRLVQIYHKSMLVVGAEKMPYPKLVKPLQSLILDLGGTTGQFGVDSVRTVFTGRRGIKTGGAVCWEGVYGEFYGGFVREGAQLMFIISNDGWWNETQAYKQLFRYSRLRAVETRRAIARSANTGKSGFINQRGDVLGSIGWDRRATITDTLLTNDKITFYTRYGDYIGRICGYVMGLCILYFIAYRVRRRSNLNA